MGLFEPTWKSKDQEKALAYIRSINNADILGEIYQEARKDDRYYEVMLHTAMRLADLSYEVKLHPKTLKALALFMYDKNTGDSFKRVVAAIDDQDTLADIALRASYEQVAVEALRSIDNQALLAEIAKNGKHQEVCLEALAKITDHVLIIDVHENAQFKQISEIAEKKALDEVANSDSKDMIDNIALSAASRAVFLRAINNLPDPVLKEQIAKSFLEKNKDKPFDPHIETILNYIADQDFLLQIVVDDNEEYDEQLRAAAVRKIYNALFLEQIILDKHKDFFVRQSALEALRHPTKLYSIILKWLAERDYVRLFDQAMAKLGSRDYKFLSSIALEDYGWEFRIAAFKRILELPNISIQDKKRMYDTLMESLITDDRTGRQASTTLQDLHGSFDY